MRVRYLRCRPKSHPFPVVAWLIMIFQGENPLNDKSTSHRAIENSEHGIIIDSTGGVGVKTNYAHKFFKKYKVVSAIQYDVDSTFDEFVKWCKAIEGREYDYLDITGDFLRRTIGLFSFKRVGNNWKKIACNEVPLSFIEYFYKKDIGDPDTYDLISTDKLMDEVKKEELCLYSQS